jgi:transcriptional regulator with XRE-family HTH domain
VKRHYMREWRFARGLRQEDLAKVIGIAKKSKSLLSRYENGIIGMTFDRQLRATRALNITPNEFFLPPPNTPDDKSRLRERAAFWKRFDELEAEDEA